MSDSPPFGQFGCLEYDPLEDALLCHFCGGCYHSLASHARLAHELGADEYRALAGLNRQTRLVTPTLRERLRQQTAPLIARLRGEGKLRNWGEDRARWERDKAAAVEVLHGEGLRAEGREHRGESFRQEPERSARAERRGERNLAGLDRATPAAIAAGLRRAAGEGECERCGLAYQREAPRQRYCPACRPGVERDYQREYKRASRPEPEAHHRPAADGKGWDVSCPRCGATFRGTHAAKYCVACRPEMMRQWQREAKRRERGRRQQGGGNASR